MISFFVLKQKNFSYNHTWYCMQCLSDNLQSIQTTTIGHRRIHCKYLTTIKPQQSRAILHYVHLSLFKWISIGQATCNLSFALKPHFQWYIPHRLFAVANQISSFAWPVQEQQPVQKHFSTHNYYFLQKLQKTC